MEEKRRNSFAIHRRRGGRNGLGLQELLDQRIDALWLFMMQPVGGIFEEYELPLAAPFDALLSEFAAQEVILRTPRQQGRHADGLPGRRTGAGAHHGAVPAQHPPIGTGL